MVPHHAGPRAVPGRDRLLPVALRLVGASWSRTGTPSALILEDDARLENGFAAVIGEAMKIAAEWDVVYLARMKRPLRTVRTVAVLDGCRRLIQCRRRTGGIGYLIRLEAAEALLHYCWRIRTPIDYLYTGWWDNGLRVYAVDPPVVRHAEMPSTIMTWKGGKWPKLKRTALEHAAGYLHRRADKTALTGAEQGGMRNLPVRPIHSLARIVRADMPPVFAAFPKMGR